jgi:hypothetical protein
VLGKYVERLVTVSIAIKMKFILTFLLPFIIDSNRKELTAAFQALFLNRTDSFADDFNTLFGTLYSKSAYMCANGCEACFDGVCGLLETTRETLIAYGKSNFTADQILNDLIVETPFVANFTFYLKNCVQYTSGTTLDGQLCFGIDLNNAAEATSRQQMCNLEYDGVPCNSCVVDLVSQEGCYAADCTNIDASAVIDSCGGTGFVGPFVFLGVLRNDNITGSNLTLGSCDVQSTPTAPTAPTPNKAPVTAPTAPVSEPTAPVSEPTAPVSGPTAPVAKPTAPVTAPSAPVKAPVKAPSAATPTAPTTSGSSVLGMTLNVVVFGFVTAATYFM